MEEGHETYGPTVYPRDTEDQDVAAPEDESDFNEETSRAVLVESMGNSIK